MKKIVVFVAMFMVAGIGCTSAVNTPPPVAPVIKNTNLTPCEQAPGSCDNYDRAGVLLGDTVRSVVQTTKEVAGQAVDTAKETYQEYKNK